MKLTEGKFILTVMILIKNVHTKLKLGNNEEKIALLKVAFCIIILNIAVP